MSSAAKVGIVQFAGEGYDVWKFRVETQLSAHGVKEMITKDEPTEQQQREAFREKDEKAKALLVAYIADSHLEYVRDKNTAKEMWNSLASTFAKKGFAAQTYIRRSLATLKMEEGTPLMDHFRRFDELVRQLKGAGATISELDAVSQLFISLPSSYDVVTTAMENLEDDQLKMDTVKARLLAEEQKRSGRDCGFKVNGVSDGSSSALAAKPLRSKERNSEKSKFQGKCFICGEVGHKKFACPKIKNRRDKAQVATIPVDREIALVLSQEERKDLNEELKIEWILDSGASRHMAYNEELFQDFKEFDNPLVIESAKKGEKLIATKEGTVKGKVAGNGLTLSFGNVLCVKNLKFNLLSLSRLLKSGVKVEFKPDRAVLSKDGEIIAVAMLRGSLFYLKMNCLAPGSAMLAKGTEGELQLWHKRFGHLSYKNIRRLKQYEMVDGLGEVSNEGGFCEPCAESKMIRMPFNKTRPRTTRPLERVHTDVCGQITPKTADGYQYFVSFIDDYTHFAVVYLMKRKDQVFEYFKVYEAMATAKFGLKIANLRCDLGREYFSNEQNAYYTKQGIQVESTVGYTPQHNGVAERFNRTIAEKMRAMLAESGAPKTMWGEAVLNAVYVTNRSPTDALKSNTTPAECWHGEKPDVGKLRVFGSLSFAWIPKQKRSKLDATGLRSVMLGYAPTGYRLWNLKTRKMFVARDVKFDETSFPFKTPEKEMPSNLVIPEVIPAPEPVEVEDVLQTVEAENDATNDDSPVVSSADEDEFEDTADNISEENASALPPQLNNGNICEEIVPRSSGRERRTPGWFTDFIAPYRALSAADESQQVPTCYAEVDGHPNELEWRKAIDDELRSLEKNQTWTMVRCPDAVKPVPSKWVFTLKTDADGNPVRYKARLVAKGYLQRKHIDYEATFAPVAKLSTIRTILAVATNRDLKVHQMDVKTAFLNGILQETVHMRVPEGVCSQPNEVCLLKKSLYGLKQSPRCWNGRFNEVLVNMGFVRSRHDYCVYVRGQGRQIVYIVIYVDDLLVVAGDIRTINEIKMRLKQEFEMTDMNELHHFLGIKIERDEDGAMHFSQEALIRKILMRFGMDNCKPVNTPAETKLQLCLSTEGCSHPYRELIGSLMFLMLGSRPDLCFIVGYLARFQDAAGEEHWRHAKRVLRYLQATKDMKLTFKRNLHEPPIKVFVDADYASDELDRKCVSGFLIKVFGCTTVWSSKKQRTVAMSSTEAEYIAMSSSISETIWLSGLLADLRESKLYPVPIHEDNQGAIAMAEKEETKRVKHIDVKFHFIREAVAERKVKLVYVPTQRQEADILTKPLPAPALITLRSKIGLETIN